MAEVTAHIGAFPWDSLERVASEDVKALSALRRTLSRYIDDEALALSLGGLVGAPIGVHLRRVHTTPFASDPKSPESVAVLLGDADGAEPRFLVETETALALALVGGALKQSRVPRVVDAARPASPKLAGALAAVLLSALRRAQGDHPVRVLQAGPASSLARALAANEPLHVASLSVLVGDDAFLAKIAVSASTAVGLAPQRWEGSDLAKLGDAPLEIPIVACASVASRESVTLLSPGDAWMPGNWPLERAANGALHGLVTLAASTSDRGVRAALGIDGRLVLRGEGEELGMADENATLVENLGEVPVVVRVEIGSAQMRAREWAELRAGDVFALGRRIAEPVTLRIGGVEVARGELIEIDGEVGVRIVSRSVAGP